ncbi:protein patched homolog 3 [Aplysia californica]|uniref:Protein patched homolog 3 n=1 Tax=Aplysia californica TaxID=6500 RepID=A0ABM1A786_APLCA|nr:protein patched homolog 3 [Aplysia californica]XP_012942198.1 protein patched homolog 3 [Aplysia californica]
MAAKEVSDVSITHVTVENERTDSKKSRDNILARISYKIVWALETSFFRVGFFVGKYPLLTIILSILMCGLCGLGMKTFKEEDAQEKLWVPQSSRIIPEKAWVDRTFPEETRFATYVVVNPNGDVLTPSFMNALLDYYIESINFDINGRKFQDMCVRIGKFCYVSSLLELWLYDEAAIRALTRNDIISMISRTKVSPLSGVDVVTLLGGQITRNESGVVVGAEASKVNWVLEKEENSDAAGFEKKMIDMALRGHENISKTYVYASRSFDDEGFGAINSDIKLLTAGFSIVFIYVILSLGKFNLIEHKIYISLSGMACVGLSILVAYGIATALDIIYSPIQTIMPFLLLGIGVDDMFVIIETWKNLSPEEEKLETPNKIAVTLSRAGVSITVTSITDMVAFGIGATTVIPALSSFCLYATLGILALYLLVSTLFIGALALDERRRRARRDACLCCYRHSSTYEPYECSTGKSIIQTFFGKFYGPFITRLPVKIFIIFLAVAMASLGIWRFVKMDQNFDVSLYLPSDSYAFAFTRAQEAYFEEQGRDASIYCGGFNYFHEIGRLDVLQERLVDSRYVQNGTINSWFSAYHNYLVTSGINITSEEQYYKTLWGFLRSPMGQRFSSFVNFNSTSEPVSIVGSYITLTHVREENSQDSIKSMDGVRYLIDSSGFPRFTGPDMPEYMCFSYARAYLSYETDKVLYGELVRNLGLAASAVLVVTIVLVANLWTSLLVFVCVVFTVMDVGGVLELWGTSIETASSILITLSVGLAVDYSAHVGHTFMTIRGDRNNRAIETLKTIGPAVFNGGLSTFLAFVLLVNSASYGFQLFFRVFSSVVIFGLFHGLAFLPVVLSLVGPPAYKHADEIPEEINMEVKDSGSRGQVVEPTTNGHSEGANGYAERSRYAYDGPMLSSQGLRMHSGTFTSKPHISVIDVPNHSKNNKGSLSSNDGLTKL